MNKISLSLAGSLMTAGLFVGLPIEAEVLVGVADTFSGPAGWGHNVLRAVE